VTTDIIDTVIRDPRKADSSKKPLSQKSRDTVPLRSRVQTLKNL